MTREIAKMAHVSFSYIKKIRMKLTGEVNEEQHEGSKEKTIVHFIPSLQTIFRRQIHCSGCYILRFAYRPGLENPF